MGKLDEYIYNRQRNQSRTRFFAVTAVVVLILSSLAFVGAKVFLSKAYAVNGYSWTDHGSINSADSNFSQMAGSQNGQILIASSSGTSSNGFIYLSTNAGSTWSQTTAISANWGYVATDATGQNLIAAQQSGYLYTSHDSGATWTKNTALGSHSWQGVVMAQTSQKVLAITSDAGVAYLYVSSDSGDNWTQGQQSESGFWSSAAMNADGSKMYAGEYYGYLYSSSDSGVSWQYVTSTGRHDWAALAVGTSDVYAMVRGGAEYVSHDSGASWSADVSISQTSVSSMALTASSGQRFVATSQGLYAAKGVGQYVLDGYFGQTSLVSVTQDGGDGIDVLGTNGHLYSSLYNSSALPGEVGNLSASNLTPNTADLSWTQSDPGAGTITGYKIEMSIDNGVSWQLFKTVSGGTSTTLTGLIANTNYQVRVTTTSDIGTGNPTNGLSFTTLTAPAPTPPTNVNVKPGLSGATVRWSVPISDNGSPIIGYDVEYKKATDTSWQTVSVSASTLQYVFTNLMPCTLYDFGVTAKNVTGPSNIVTHSTTSTPIPLGANPYQANFGVSHDGSVIAYVTTNQLVTLSTDRGQTWNSLSDTVPSYDYAVALSADGTTIITSGSVDRISHDRGATWSTVTGINTSNGTSYALSSDGTTVYATVYGDGIYKSIDGGTTWTSLNVPVDNWYSLAYAESTDTLYASTYDFSAQTGVIYKMSSDGTNMVSVKTYNDGQHVVNGLSVSADGLVLVASIGDINLSNNASQAIVSTNQGATWVDYGTDVSSAVFAVNAAGTNLYYPFATSLVTSSIQSLQATPLGESSSTGGSSPTSQSSDSTTKTTLPAKSSTNVPAATDNNSSGSITPQVLSDSGLPLVSGQTILSMRTFSGYATPGATITVTVHSNPQTCMATADASGYWKCRIANDLPKGTHTVAVSIVNLDGTTEQFGPYNVTVAGTATATTPVAHKASVAGQSFPLLAIIALVVSAAIIVTIIMRHRSRKIHSI